MGWETWQKQLLQSLGKQYAQCLGGKMMCKPDNNLYRLIMIKMTLQYHTIHYHPFKIIIKLKQFWGLIRIISEEKVELPELISILLWWKFPSPKIKFLENIKRKMEIPSELRLWINRACGKSTWIYIFLYTGKKCYLWTIFLHGIQSSCITITIFQLTNSKINAE